MNRPGGRRLETVLADFAEQHGVLSRAREQIRALTVTARSRDGAVEVTVDAEGRVAGICFVGRRFREMTDGQLDESVAEAWATARSEVTARATALVTSARCRLPAAVGETAAPDRLPRAPEPARETPGMCWRSFVREARAVTAGLVPMRDSGPVKGGTVGVWGSAGPESGPGLTETARSRAAGPAVGP